MAPLHGSSAQLCCGLAGLVYALLNLYKYGGNKAWLEYAHKLGKSVNFEMKRVWLTKCEPDSFHLKIYRHQPKPLSLIVHPLASICKEYRDYYNLQGD